MPPRRYMILESDSTSGLQEKVGHHLARGWKVCGGVALQSVPRRPQDDPTPGAIEFTRYLQAVRLPLRGNRKSGIENRK